ncbi:MAG: patatin-like phospholipase family protein [Dehalococcoidia bacterium]
MPRQLKLGLALGAGGTKGAAHVGVLRVLEHAGIRPDVIAGTSVGSLYGGAFAVGRTAAEMEDGIRTCPPNDVIQFFRHRLKIRHRNRLARRFYEALAGWNIEDLPIKYAATASDIVERGPVAIDRGPIIDAIEASIAIPVIARPVLYQGRYLLDGGFWDSAPVDAAVGLGADVVVAVELGKPLSLPEVCHRPAAWIAGRLAKAALHRTIAGVPFTLHAATTPLKPGRTAQLVIRPRGISRIRGNSPFHMVDVLEAGIAAAEAALPSIKALLAGEPLPAEATELIANPKLATDLGAT